MSTIHLALHDALANQRDHGATTTLALRGGQTFVGRVKPPPTGRTYHQQETVYIEVGCGWATVLISELAAVGAQP